VSEIRPTHSNDNVLGALGHLFGIIVAIIIWAVQKDKSEYVRFQAAQAVGFGLSNMIVEMIAVGLCLVLIFVFKFLAIISSLVTGSAEVPAILVPFLNLSLISSRVLVCLLALYSLVIAMTHLIATISVLRSKDFRYPWLGKRVEKFLNTK
jgi:uncharacterized Tic20 family protein